MKTAISIPDPLFESADDLARRLGLSRSQLYANALTQYLAQHRGDRVTEALNGVYEENSSSVDDTVLSMQVRSLRKKTGTHRDEW